jgi:hypothetical protein
MNGPRDALHTLVDQLPEAELGAAKRFLEFLSQEEIGPELAASIRRGISEANRGETIVCGSYEEMVEKLLGRE